MPDTRATWVRLLHSPFGMLAGEVSGRVLSVNVHPAAVEALRAIGCFGLTKSDLGSDPAGMRTNAKRDGSDLVLSGNKMWITNGSIGGCRGGMGSDR